jgi:hypothetical protein
MNMCMRVYSNLITEYGCMAAEKVSAAREQAERIVTIIVIKRALHSTTQSTPARQSAFVE